MKKRSPKFLIVVVLVLSLCISAGIATANVFSRGGTQEPPVAVQPLGHVAALEGSPSPAEVALAAAPAVQHDVAAITADAGTVPDTLLPGTRVGPIRVPLAHLGSGDRVIWMYQTDRGKLCYGLTQFSAGCLDSLPIGQPLNPIAGDPRDGGGPIVWGYAADDVTAVTVVGSGFQSPAILGRNAFFFQAPTTGTQILSVVATLSGGSRVNLDIPQPRSQTGAASRPYRLP